MSDIEQPIEIDQVQVALEQKVTTITNELKNLECRFKTLVLIATDAKDTKKKLKEEIKAAKKALRAAKSAANKKERDRKTNAAAKERREAKKAA